MGAPRLPILERLDKHSYTDPETGCKIWTGASYHGYGMVRYKYHTHKAHRLAYELAYGKLPLEMCVCHTCDNRLCINLEHLWRGTKADNNADMWVKQRHAHGSSNGHAKLKEEDILRICALYNRGWKQREIAVEFGVTDRMISCITTGKNWKHIKREINIG